MANGIQKELADVTKVVQKDGEKEQTFLRRVFDKANSLPAAGWESLSEPTQKWVNAASEAVDNKTAIPNFDGSVAEEEVEVATKKDKKKADAKADKAKAAKGKAEPAAAKGAKKGAKASASEDSGKRGRKGTYPLEASITLKAGENPHRKTSKDFEKFKKLKSGMSVEKAIGAGVDWGYLRYAVDREFISVK